MAAVIQGSLRSRFQVLSRHFSEIQRFHPVTWCVFRALLGNDRGKVVESNNILTCRRSAGSYLDIKKHHRVHDSQVAKYNHLPVILINATFNNTIITIGDKNGRQLGWVSAGTEGFQNSKRGSNTAGRQAGIAAGHKAISLGIDRARIKLRGIGQGRTAAVNGIEFAGVDIVSVTDVTPVPHNGCRPRKVRRM